MPFTLAHPANAQEPGQPLYTMHVYNNLVQFATIVRNEDLTPVQPIARDKFAITLDSGPAFHPTQMRREGDDSIALAVVLDAGGSQRDLLAGFPEAFSQLFPAFLHANDHLSIYAEDCSVTRTLYKATVDGATAKAALIAAQNAPRLHGTKAKPACGSELHLWDTLALVATQLADEPGRRVILLISDGDEYKSKVAFADLRNFASSRGTAVFAMQDVNDMGPRGGLTSMRNMPIFSSNGEHLLEALVSRSGGLMLKATPRTLLKKLQDFIMILRERYIIEFPRPDTEPGGKHEIVITIPGTPLLIRATGAVTPPPDPTLGGDPHTLRSPASPAMIGKRKPLN